MTNNFLFTTHIEQLITADEFTQASALLLGFLRDFNAQNASKESIALQKQVVQIAHDLNDVNRRTSDNAINANALADFNKKTWIALHKIKDKIGNLPEIHHAFDATQIFDYVPTHEAKPKTWREAGWLPLLVAAGVVGVLFLIGLDYNSKVKAQKKADYEAKNGILPQNTEGSLNLKLVEPKTSIGMDDALNVSIKAVKGDANKLEITTTIQHKFKTPMRQLDFSVIDIAQNGKALKIQETAADLGEIPSNSLHSEEKKLHLNYAVGESRQFQLYLKFTNADLKQQGAIVVPFSLR